MTPPETGFDVNLERKQWSMRTGPQQLFATRNRQAADETPADGARRPQLPRHFHDAVTVPTQPKPPPAPPPKTEQALRIDTSHPDTPAFRLRWLQGGYIGAIVLMAIVVPVFLNHGPLAIYYIVMCAGPLWLATFTLHALAALLAGDRAGPLLAGVLLSLALPALFIALRYLPVTDARGALYAAVALPQAFYGLTAGRHFRPTTTITLALFFASTVATELAPWDREWALSGLSIWNTVVTCALALWSLYTRDHLAFAVTIWGEPNT